MHNKSGAIIIEGHVQGLSNTRSLGKAGIPVFVVDKRQCIAAKSKYCQKFFLCPDFQSDQFADFLCDLARTENINGWVLIPSNDHAVYTISKHNTKLSKYYKIITPGIEVIENIYDKIKLLKIAKQIGTPYPITQVFNSVEDSLNPVLNFPVITKGRNGLSFYKATGKKAFLAKDESELKKQLHLIQSKNQLTNSFSQELIPFDGTNKTISLAAFCIDGEIKTYWMGAKLREHPLQFGTATFTESIFEKDCLDYATKLLKELKYTGVCEVEFLFDPRDRKFKLIEINARTWLWVGHAIACGINFPLYIYNYLNNIETVYPTQYKTQIKWRNPFSDRVYSIAALIKGKLTPSQYKAQNKGKVVDALWDKDDKKPYFAYGLLMFNFLRNR